MKRLLIIAMTVLGLTALSSERGSAQFYSLSTNVAALATGSVNAEWSMTLNRSWSLHLGGSVNPWRIEQFRIQHLMVRPSIRWWASESYRGWWLGSHFCGAYAHVGIPRLMKRKYEGVAMGGGLDVGYTWAMDTRWNIEVGLGAGAYYVDMWAGRCHTCSYRADEVRRWVFLPDNIKVSMIYLF